jgi:PPP family 3-phenylpropionic acid transporter
LVSSGGSFDARRYGRVRLWGSLGFLLTVFAAGAWFERFGMGHFPAWTMLTLLGVVASVWCLPNIKEDTQVQPGAQAPPLAGVLRQAPVRWLFASAFLHVLAQMGIYVFFSLYLDALGYSKTMIGVLWAVSVVAEVGWFFSQSRWLPLCSLTAWLVVCAGVSVLRMGLTAGGALANQFGLRAVFVAAVAVSVAATACAFRVWRLQHPAISARG